MSENVLDKTSVKWQQLSSKYPKLPLDFRVGVINFFITLSHLDFIQSLCKCLQGSYECPNDYRDYFKSIYGFCNSRARFRCLLAFLVLFRFTWANPYDLTKFLICQQKGQPKINITNWKYRNPTIHISEKCFNRWLKMQHRKPNCDSERYLQKAR